MTVLIACLLALHPDGGATAGFDDLEPGGSAVVAAVRDGDTLALADGRVVRLAGIAAPKVEAGQARADAEAVREALASLAVGREVRLGYGGLHQDRHGRYLAHLFVVDRGGTSGPWLQGALLERGLARVVTTPDARALAPDMLALESAARAAGRGLWAGADYRIRTPDDVAAAIDSFQIVEGTVFSAKQAGSRVYLNFGPDYATDFTLALDSTARRLFRDAGLDPLSLAGRRIRARGWVRSFAGPRIDISHPEQVEVLP